MSFLFKILCAQLELQIYSKKNGTTKIIFTRFTVDPYGLVVTTRRVGVKVSASRIAIANLNVRNNHARPQEGLEDQDITIIHKLIITKFCNVINKIILS